MGIRLRQIEDMVSARRDKAAPDHQGGTLTSNARFATAVDTGPGRVLAARDAVGEVMRSLAYAVLVERMHFQVGEGRLARLFGRTWGVVIGTVGATRLVATRQGIFEL